MSKGNKRNDKSKTLSSAAVGTVFVPTKWQISHFRPQQSPKTATLERLIRYCVYQDIISVRGKSLRLKIFNVPPYFVILAGSIRSSLSSIFSGFAFVLSQIFSTFSTRIFLWNHPKCI